ncbi:protein channel TOM70 SCDLUD_002886 [Saccharomycodes ludwigii]|uniref:protein channel TOM70 n=1 Tax=Saccharomycodes ludwigii TaxID=36035 RepID=UPI001E849FEB|nr:hypothetical protein SCDLUD_002886 [Saccharomycodes ludwigii]KAH3901394.1 hypothetical protein SCDLUD_002886 [Saccharomycodes ludwigii]
MGNQEKVVEDTTTALELNPEYSKCRLRRASANEALGKYEDAMLDVSALSLFGDYNNASIESMLERILNKRVTENLEGRLKEQQKESHKKLISATDLASFFGSFKPELTFDDYDPENKADVLLKEALETLYAKTLHGFETADEKFAEAIKLYKEANDDKNNKKYAIALEYSGVLDFFKMDAISSFEKVSKAIELNPRAQSYIFMGLINADKAAANGEDYMADLNKAIELDPQNSSAYYHRAQYKFISKDLEGAAKDFEKSKELDPEFVFPYIQLACLTYREGKFSDCETLFSEAKRKFPKAPEVPSFYGEVLTDHGDYAKASKQYDAAIKLEEECAPTIHLGVNPWVAKATVLVAEPTVENFVEAVNLLEKANELDPKSSKVKLTLGQLKLQQSELDEAIQLFDAAADLTMNAEEKVGAIRLVEASKVQKKLHADPFLSKKINELLASIQGGGFGI